MSTDLERRVNRTKGGCLGAVIALFLVTLTGLVILALAALAPTWSLPGLTG